MKIRTKVKGGYVDSINHNGTTVRVKTKIRAGGLKTTNGRG